MPDDARSVLARDPVILLGLGWSLILVAWAALLYMWCVAFLVRALWGMVAEWPEAGDWIAYPVVSMVIGFEAVVAGRTAVAVAEAAQRRMDAAR